MNPKFIWQQQNTLHRETRKTAHGTELRWMLNKEQILDQQTGEIITRSFIRHPGICVIVPFASADEIFLLRQYRYAVDDELWELPAGTLAGIENNFRVSSTENPEECAARELIEEAGYEAGKLKKFAECYAIPGSGDELMHFYFADDLVKREQALDAGEIISEVKKFTLAEIETMILKGEIRDAKTLIGLFYALRKNAEARTQ
jgi:ADP-ribose pyrophosphatase